MVVNQPLAPARLDRRPRYLIPPGTAVVEPRHARVARVGGGHGILGPGAWRTGGRLRVEGPLRAPRPKGTSGLGIVWAVALGVLAGWSTFAPGPTLRAGMVLAVVVVAAHLSPRTRPSATAIFGSLFTADICLSWFWAARPDAAAITALSHVGAFTIFLAVRTVVTDRTRFLLIAGGYLLGCLWTVHLISVMNPAAVFALRFTDRRFAIPGLNPNYAAYAFVGSVRCV